MIIYDPDDPLLVQVRPEFAHKALPEVWGNCHGYNISGPARSRTSEEDIEDDTDSEDVSRKLERLLFCSNGRMRISSCPGVWHKYVEWLSPGADADAQPAVPIPSRQILPPTTPPNQAPPSSSGTDTVVYLHSDHLGSLSATDLAPETDSPSHLVLTSENRQRNSKDAIPQLFCWLDGNHS